MAGRRVFLRATIADEGWTQKFRACTVLGYKAIPMFVPVMLDLIRDRCGILADQLPDCLECHSLAQAFLDLLAVLGGQVFVLLDVLLDHDVASSLGLFSQS